MNDTKKLRQIVDTLEEQSSRVTEFNGVLSAINDARKEIDSANATLNSLAMEQSKAIRNMTTMQFVTPEQYNQGRTVTEAKFSEQFSKISERINAASSGLESCNVRLTQLESQLKSLESAIKSLRTTMIVGLIVLASGIAFLAVTAFM